MIQFNLLPDVKIKYIKTQRTKRMVIITSLIVTAASLALATVLFVSVQIVQKKRLTNSSADIKKEMDTLNSVEDLNKILTIQNQLSSLPGLHDGKPVSSRVLGYIVQLTPTLASISKLDVDFETNTFTITGAADSLVTVNKYADSVKFATYTTATKKDAVKPFSNVVTTLTSDQGKATYLLTFNFDPILFSNTEVPVLSIPAIISNRSETEKPSAVFKEEPIPVTVPKTTTTTTTTTTKKGTN